MPTSSSPKTTTSHSAPASSVPTPGAALHLPGHKIRKDYSDSDPDWESDFTILKNALCPSALSENLFNDNVDDLAFHESAPGRQAIIDLHVRGIITYVKG